MCRSMCVFNVFISVCTFIFFFLSSFYLEYFNQIIAIEAKCVQYFYVREIYILAVIVVYDSYYYEIRILYVISIQQFKCILTLPCVLCV